MNFKAAFETNDQNIKANFGEIVTDHMHNNIDVLEKLKEQHIKCLNNFKDLGELTNSDTLINLPVGLYKFKNSGWQLVYTPDGKVFWSGENDFMYDLKGEYTYYLINVGQSVSFNYDDNANRVQYIFDAKNSSLIIRTLQNKSTIQNNMPTLKWTPVSAYSIDNTIVNKSYIDDKIGDIETALDNIIEVQNELMGVSE